MSKLFLLLFLLPVMSFAQTTDFNQLVDQFFDSYFQFNPTAGTAAGFHQYDTKLEDYSKTAIDQQVAWANDYLKKFGDVEAARLSLEQRQDRELILNNLHAALLEWQNIRSWEKNPDRYSSGITSSAFVIMARKFAPPEQRLRSLIDREKQMPAVFDAGRANLKNPPRVYTEVAIEQMPFIIGFFQHDVPEAFQGVKDAKLLGEFKQSNAAVIAALQKYENYLQHDLLPASHGDYKIGADNYRKKLEYEEMVDIPLDRLLQIGTEDLQRNQQKFKEVSAEIDPKKTPQEILHELEKDHPTAAGLLPAFRNTLKGLRDFIEQHHIVTIPSPVLPIVEETPPFGRALTSASMDTPGPYEKVAKEAFFNVTPPEKSWPKDKIESWLEGFNRGTIISTAVHEAYPGHYVQFLWVPSSPSKTRKLLGAGSNAEGWAHYTEQMMLDEGYGRNPALPENKDIPFLKLRLGQLQDALLRDARFICGIKMHTGQMTLEECTKFFVSDGYQTPAVAEREAKRGTSDPTYLVYTLGKLEIMKLRDDVKAKEGASFNLQKFHDDFLRQGFPPVKMIRETMLGNDSPVL
ncbi:MAG TPA: DUF885 domain-containing protein [Terriglobales bacterium]|nr:DUF885 domain-containing protein [Terriglobales bacterium]